MATTNATKKEDSAAVKTNVEYESCEDCYGSRCMSGASEAGKATSVGKGVVPSRTLKLNAAWEKPLTEEDLAEALAKHGELHSTDVTQQEQGFVFARFFDLRVAMAALQEGDLEGHFASVEFASDRAARDLDEEGRVVVRVEGHLGSNELCHIFSTYGDVRNIQDVPNINIHKVVEFFDVRSAAKAVQALNAVDTDAMHAASVAYLERTRCKLFLIPPRLSEAAGFAEGGTTMTESAPKTFPLGGATKPVAPDFELPEEITQMTDSTTSTTATTIPAMATVSEEATISMSRLFDSSSSLFGSPDQLGFISLPSSTSAALSAFSCLPDSSIASTFADQSSNDSSNGLTLKEILPSGLGLYEDDETADRNFSRMRYEDSASYEILSANRGSGWNPTLSSGLGALDDLSFDGFSPLTTSLMEHIGGSPLDMPPGLDTSFMSEQQKQDVLVLSQYLECYEQATVFQQAVRLEVMKRLNSLKSFDTTRDISSDPLLQKLRSGEEWKTASSRMHHRKKGGRFPRRSSALDLEQESERRAQQEKMFAMDLERVRSGKDKRTTLMIKNIPNKYTQRMLLTRIEQEFKGTFDFFYLPIDFKNKCNVGYGFINMTSTEHIVSFVEHVHQQKWDKFNSDKVCCVTYARIQGRHALINHFQNSSLMLEDSKHQPLLFKPNGDPEPFPMKPTSA